MRNEPVVFLRYALKVAWEYIKYSVTFSGGILLLKNFRCILFVKEFFSSLKSLIAELFINKFQEKLSWL